MNAGVLGRFLAPNANPGRNTVEPNETWSVRVGVAAWPSPTVLAASQCQRSALAQRKEAPLASLSVFVAGRRRTRAPRPAPLPQRERGAAFPALLITNLPASLTPTA